MKLTTTAANSAVITADAADALAGALAAKSVSSNTRRAYKSAITGLQAWLDITGQTLSDSSLASYIATLDARGLAPSSGRQVVAAVSFAARKAGVDSPVGEKSREVMAGFTREGAGRGRGQTQGLSWRACDTASAVASQQSDNAVAVEAGVARNSLAGLRDAAIIAAQSDLLGRSSEVCALQVSDFKLAGDGSGRITIRKSKTDKRGRGEVMFVGAPTTRRIQQYLDAAGIQTGFLFRQIRRGGAVQTGGLSTNSIAKIIKGRVKAAGLDSTRIAGHSCRVGTAQELAAANCSLVNIQKAGRWSSPSMPAHYARAQLAAKGAVAQARYKAAA